jgi:hypothetical protein
VIHMALGLEPYALPFNYFGHRGALTDIEGK